MPNDARTKLRGMGGIMASSPELMQAAQGYQPGGMVAPKVPLVDSVTVPGTGAPVVGLGRVPPMMPQGPRPEGLPSMLPERPVQRFVAGMQPDPYAPTPGSYLLDEPDQTVDSLLEGSGAETFTVPETVPSTQRGPQDIMLLPEVIVGSVPYRVDVETGGVFRNDGTPVRGAEAEAALRQAPEALYTAERASSSAAERRARKKLEANQERLKELDEEKIGGVAPSSEAAEEEAALKEETRALSDELGSFASAEDTVMAQEVAPSLTPEQMAEEGRKALEGLVPPKSEDPEEADKTAREAMDTLLRNRAGGDGGDGGDGGNGGDDGGEPTPLSYDDYYAKAENIVSKAFPDLDKGSVGIKMMDLVLMGLAIASGTSPNALINFAQGAMMGVQGVAKRQQQERERRQQQRTAATELAIDMQSAASEAEREAAASRLDFERDVILEGMKARGGSGKSGYENVPRVAEQAVVVEDQILKGVSDGSIAVPEQYRDNQQAFITNEKNKRVLEYIDTLGLEGQIDDPRTRAQLGQQFMYRDVDPDDVEAGRFPVVRSARELSFILPGQDYLRYNPSTGKYTRETKPVSE